MDFQGTWCRHKFPGSTIGLHELPAEVPAHGQGEDEEEEEEGERRQEKMRPCKDRWWPAWDVAIGVGFLWCYTY